MSLRQYAPSHPVVLIADNTFLKPKWLVFIVLIVSMVSFACGARVAQEPTGTTDALLSNPTAIPTAIFEVKPAEVAAARSDEVPVEDIPTDQANHRISITNDEAALEERINRTNQNIALDTANSDSGKSFFHQLFSESVASAADMSMTLVAEVSPPTINGQVLQASSVTIKGPVAYVSYNMRGEPFLGAIDVFDIKNPEKPKLISEALFSDSDVHSLTFDKNTVYASMGTGDESFQTPAAFEVIKIVKGKLVLEENARVDLPSYAGTSIAISGNDVFAVSGNTGGIYIHEENSLSRKNQSELSDARWVDVGERHVVVVQGTPGQLTVFDKNSLEFIASYSVDGADIPESKSTVQILGDNALIAAGTGGAVILDIHSGQTVGHIPVPVVEGLDNSVVVTNAASADGNIIFLSNGEAGVYLAESDHPLRDATTEDSISIELLGRLRFDNLESVNHVEYRENTLIVAAGIGGLKIVSVDFN